MLETASLALVAFLVTIDPVALVPIYLALSAREDPPARRRLALRGCLVGGGVLVGLRFLRAKATRGPAPEKRQVTLRFRAVLDQN